MNIFVISSDSFLAQEIITHFNSESHSIEIHENGLDVLSDTLGFTVGILLVYLLRNDR